MSSTTDKALSVVLNKSNTSCTVFVFLELFTIVLLQLSCNSKISFINLNKINY